MFVYIIMPAPFSTEETPAVAATPWAVSATHTNLDQAITSSTNVTLSDGTVGNYQASLLFADHRISLPLPGTITHFVSPEQPIFTFTQPTRVFMFIPTTTNVAPIKLEGWAYVPMGLSGNASPMLNFPVPAFDELFSGVISSVDYDYCYEKLYVAGTFNLDPNSLAPEAFYLFEELIDGNVLSELRQRQMYVFENVVFENSSGNYGFGTTNPSARLHVDGNVLVTNGNINVAKNEDQICHFGRGRIGHFNITNPNTNVTTSSVSFSHHDCNDGTNFALLQTEDGESLFNSATGKHTEFRLGGAEKMRLHTNGYIGINQQSPTEALDVGGNIRASGNIKTTGFIEAHANSNDASAVSQIGNAKIGANTWPNYVSFSHKNHHTSSGYGIRLGHDGNTAINAGETVGIHLKLNDQIAMVIKKVNNSRNVGIGTSSPGEKLEVDGNIKATGSIESGSGDVMLRVMSGLQTDGNLIFGRSDVSDESRSSSINVYNSFQNSANKMNFNIHNGSSSAPTRTTAMTLTGEGRVGIGAASPSEKLEVDGNIKAKGVMYNSSATTKEWRIYVVPNGNLHFAFNSGNGSFGDKGFLNQAANVSAIDFTGQHRSKFEGAFTPELVGLIVESTGNYLQLDGSVSPKIDEALPCVKLTSAAMSKRVYGILSGIEGETREYGSGFVSVVPKDDGVTRVVVNSVGEGSLWVINTRDQALQNGDYVCSSSVPGYGERQEDDLLHSYTVAKITMDVDWSNLPDWLKTRRVTSSGEVSETGALVAALVGVTYHCG